MAWLRPSAVDRTPRANRGDACPRHRVGIVAPAALRGCGDSAIREPVYSVRCRADRMVDDYHPCCGECPGQRGCGDAFSRIRELVCVLDVGTARVDICFGALDSSGNYRLLGYASATNTDDLKQLALQPGDRYGSHRFPPRYQRWRTQEIGRAHV